MRKNLLILAALLFVIVNETTGQTRKILVEINSIVSGEKIEFAYNTKNQLTSVAEKGTVSFRRFTLKYNKESHLAECTINSEAGSMVQNSKFVYENQQVTETARYSGKLVRNNIETNELKLDNEGHLIQTYFDDGMIWEKFGYTGNDITTYIINPSGKNGGKTISFRYGNINSVFSCFSDLPKWFWTYNVNNTAWCMDFMGERCAVEKKAEETGKDTKTVIISYDLDSEGYPIRQIYDGNLAREFVWKTLK